MQFQPEYSNFIKFEFARLDTGNASEKKRAQIARSKIISVCQAPTSPVYAKDLPDSYCAVRASERFKIFFKIHHEHNIVFFAWMNDEDSIHTSGSVNDSYQEFRRKLSNGEIETYTHLTIEGEDFDFNGNWGNSYIYIEFIRTLNDQSAEKASSSLTLSQIKDKEYAISSIDVSDEDRGLASELLRRTFVSADQSEITMTYELFLISGNPEKSRHLLSKFNFELIMPDSEIELWVREPRRR